MATVIHMGLRHFSYSGVSCDACGKGGFGGKRYKCLICYDFDLCSECYDAGREGGNGQHEVSHPMQCILTRVDAGGLLCAGFVQKALAEVCHSLKQSTIPITTAIITCCGGFS